MKIYRMVLTEHGASLKAPGVAGRWNSVGKFVVYASESRSLSCLENIVHRSTESLMRNYIILVIEIPQNVIIEPLNERLLPENWNLPYNYKSCQVVGDAWITGNKSCILKVPSAIINKEYNFLLNINHPDFLKIRIRNKENFLFDPRVVS